MTVERSAHPIVFGDDDPEDSWDALDPLDVKVAVIRRWVASLEDAVAAGGYEVNREQLRVALARESINSALYDPTASAAVRMELAALDARLDNVRP